MPDEVAKLTAVFEADSSDLEDGIARVDNGLSGLSGRLGSAIGNVGDSFTGIGRSMLAFSAPAIAGFGLVTTAALGFGTEMTNIQAVTGDSNEEIAALGNTILDVDSKFSNVELASTFYDIAGGVTDVNSRMEVFNAAVSTAQAGNADLKATTQALISVVNSYGANVLEAADASDVLTRTVGMGVGTMNDFANAFPDVAGLAASLNIPFEDLGASLAYMTTQGFSATESATILKNMMSSLLNPTADLAGVISDLGYESGQAMINALGVAGSYQAILDSQGTFSGVITNQEALTGAIAVTKDTAEDLQLTMGNFKINLPTSDIQDFTATFREGVEDATAMAEAIQMEDAAAQIALLKNEADDLAVIMGGALAPALVDVTQEAKPLVRQFSTFARQHPGLIRGVAMLALGIAGLGLAFTVIGSVLGVVGTAFAVVGGAIGFLLSPVGLLVAGVVALGAAFAWMASENIFGLGDALGSLFEGLKQGLSIITNFGGGLLDAFESGGISAAVQYFKDQFIGALVQVGVQALATGVEIANNIGAGLATGIPQIAEKARGLAAAAAPAFANAMIQQGPALQAGAAQFGEAIDRESPKVATRGGFMAGLLVGDFITAMINYGPTILGAVAIMGYHIGAGVLQIGAAVAGWAWDVGVAFGAAFTFGLIVKLPGIWTALEGQFNALIGTPIKEWFNGMAQDAAEGWKNGFGLSNIGDWVKGEYEKMVNKVKEFLGIASPSTVFAEIGKNVGQGFINGVGTILGGLTAAAQSMYNAVEGPLHAMINLANEAMSAVNSTVSSSIGAPIAPTVVGGSGSTQDVLDTSLGLPGRAAGGPVSGGTPYIVGEVGPELFVPKTSGTIVPNHALGGNGGGGVTINGGTFILQGIQNVQQLYDDLARLNKQRGSNAAFAKAG